MAASVVSRAPLHGLERGPSPPLRPRSPGHLTSAPAAARRWRQHIADLRRFLDSGPPHLSQAVADHLGHHRRSKAGAVRAPSLAPDGHGRAPAPRQRHRRIVAPYAGLACESMYAVNLAGCGDGDEYVAARKRSASDSRGARPCLDAIAVAAGSAAKDAGATFDAGDDLDWLRRAWSTARFSGSLHHANSLDLLPPAPMTPPREQKQRAVAVRNADSLVLDPNGNDRGSPAMSKHCASVLRGQAAHCAATLPEVEFAPFNVPSPSKFSLTPSATPKRRGLRVPGTTRSTAAAGAISDRIGAAARNGANLEEEEEVVPVKFEAPSQLRMTPERREVRNSATSTRHGLNNGIASAPATARCETPTRSNRSARPTTPYATALIARGYPTPPPKGPLPPVPRATSVERLNEYTVTPKDQVLRGGVNEIVPDPDKAQKHREGSESPTERILKRSRLVQQAMAERIAATQQLKQRDLRRCEIVRSNSRSDCAIGLELDVKLDDFPLPKNFVAAKVLNGSREGASGGPNKPLPSTISPILTIAETRPRGMSIRRSKRFRMAYRSHAVQCSLETDSLSPLQRWQSTLSKEDSHLYSKRPVTEPQEYRADMHGSRNSLGLTEGSDSSVQSQLVSFECRTKRLESALLAVIQSTSRQNVGEFSEEAVGERDKSGELRGIIEYLLGNEEEP